jgi:hypothetical protein
MNPIPKNKTRRASSVTPESQPSSYAVNSGLEQFLNLNVNEAYKRPWHRLERGLRLNRLRKFIETETSRMNLQVVDVENLTNLLHKALDKKILNSKTAVIYDQEKEEIQEIKGLIYHKTADGRIQSQILEKKQGITLRRKNKAESTASSASGGSVTQQSLNSQTPPQ